MMAHWPFRFVCVDGQIQIYLANNTTGYVNKERDSCAVMVYVKNRHNTTYKKTSSTGNFDHVKKILTQYQGLLNNKPTQKSR
jgi:hypothetical protein